MELDTHPPADLPDPVLSLASFSSLRRANDTRQSKIWSRILNLAPFARLNKTWSATRLMLKFNSVECCDGISGCGPAVPSSASGFQQQRTIVRTGELDRGSTGDWPAFVEELPKIHFLARFRASAIGIPEMMRNTLSNSSRSCTVLNTTPKIRTCPPAANCTVSVTVVVLRTPNYELYLRHGFIVPFW